MTRTLNIGIDLDGVCYDFVGALRKHAHEAFGYRYEDIPPAETWDFFKLQWGWTTQHYLEVFRDGVVRGTIFWAGDPMPGVVSALNALREDGHRITIVTHRTVAGAEEECVEATLHWLDFHSIPHDDVLFTGEKVARGLDVLLDDAPHNIAAASAVGERAIFWTQPWNLDTPHERVDSWPSFIDIIDRMADGEAPGRPFVLGLTGYARTGKDTVGRMLVEEKGFERLSFADVLRNVLYGTNPLVPGGESPKFGLPFSECVRLADLVDRIGWEKAKDTIPEVRELLQRLGTEGGRAHIAEDVWVKAALKAVQPAGKYVVTDVRFPNEADAIRKLGGEVWRIERPGYEPVNAHVSDQGIAALPVQRVIVNDGTKSALRRAVFAQWTPA